MSESIGVDSALGGRMMPNPYAAEMRRRVIERVESGASRREAAEHFEISASAAVKWLQRWRDAGSSTAKSRGGSTSPLEKQANWLLALISAFIFVQPAPRRYAKRPSPDLHLTGIPLRP